MPNIEQQSAMKGGRIPSARAAAASGRRGADGQHAERHCREYPPVIHAVARDVPHLAEVHFAEHVCHQQHSQRQRRSHFTAYTPAQSAGPIFPLYFLLSFFAKRNSTSLKAYVPDSPGSSVGHCDESVGSHRVDHPQKRSPSARRRKGYGLPSLRHRRPRKRRREARRALCGTHIRQPRPQRLAKTRQRVAERSLRTETWPSTPDWERRCGIPSGSR